jgi:hypothetical protein
MIGWNPFWLLNCFFLCLNFCNKIYNKKKTSSSSKLDITITITSINHGNFYKHWITKWISCFVHDGTLESSSLIDSWITSGRMCHVNLTCSCNIFSFTTSQLLHYNLSITLSNSTFTSIQKQHKNKNNVKGIQLLPWK